MSETAYDTLEFKAPELVHGYGAGIHLLSDVVLLSELAELSQPETSVPRCNRLVRDLYLGLLRYVLASEFPRRRAQVKTRMFEHTPRGIFSGELIDRQTPAVTVALARAGTLPSQVCFEFLGELLASAAVRQDHVYLNRKVNAAGEVIGTNYSGSKIGGAVKDAMLLIPDPMAATGGSMQTTIDLYTREVKGPPRRIVAMHLIVTPEYLHFMHEKYPHVVVYAVRADRGLSSQEILKQPLGAAGERGLNEHQYIVPGLGGLGELLNNAWV